MKGHFFVELLSCLANWCVQYADTMFAEVDLRCVFCQASYTVLSEVVLLVCL